ncbi:hypothetical protein NQ318_019233 [Aromia moschata]|uniref:Uncharacterized protein n=1 Tax=Aromia moschata TaxID=1265417 RepID=A0AAV8Z0E6_9CUCU|nr:hypothetical protein NQ318_019233 [Aromia moschata]
MGQLNKKINLTNAKDVFWQRLHRIAEIPAVGAESFCLSQHGKRRSGLGRTGPAVDNHEGDRPLPPIPGEQPVLLNKQPPKEDGDAGEAPMEMENDKEEAPAWNVSEPPPPPGAEPWNWNAQSQSWNWNNSWVPPTAVPPPPTIGPLKPPLLPTPNNMYNAPPESVSDNAMSVGGYSSQQGSGSNSDYGSGYWTGSSGHKHIKPHNKRYSKVNVPIRDGRPCSTSEYAHRDPRHSHT